MALDVPLSPSLTAWDLLDDGKFRDEAQVLRELLGRAAAGRRRPLGGPGRGGSPGPRRPRPAQEAGRGRELPAGVLARHAARAWR